jgi:acyl carrier protein
MTIDEILDQVLSTLRELSHGAVIEANDSLGDIENLDSLAFEEVLARFEEDFGIELPVAQITDQTMSTPRRMAQTLHTHQQERQDEQR